MTTPSFSLSASSDSTATNPLGLGRIDHFQLTGSIERLEGLYRRLGFARMASGIESVKATQLQSSEGGGTERSKEIVSSSVKITLSSPGGSSLLLPPAGRLTTQGLDAMDVEESAFAKKRLELLK